MPHPAIAPPEFSAPTRQLPADLTDAERAALLVAAAPNPPQAQLHASHRDLGRVLAPICQAAEELHLTMQVRLRVRLAVLRTMAATGRAYPTWDPSTWAEAARGAGHNAPSVLAVAHRLGCLTGEDALAFVVRPTWFAYRVFGHEAVEGELHRVQEYLENVGYGRKTARDFMLSSALSRLILLAGRPKLEAITVDMLEAVHSQIELGIERRRALFRIGRALHGLGLLPRDMPHRV